MRDKKTLRTREGESDRIRVYVRVRPRTPEESKRQEELGVEYDKFEVSLYDAKERRYKFDNIFSSQASNGEVFKTVGRPLVDAVFSGFNGTLMAYGQTGTGKTHTLMSNDGICVQVVEKLFKRIHLDKHHDYKVYMSYLQIYQEKIFDLLNANSKVELVLREDPKKGVYVENLSEFVVGDTAEVLSLLKLGMKKLIFAETRMNRVSSRSHSVCQITVERTRCKGSVKPAAEGSSSESNLLSLSSTLTPPSRKTVRSTGSLDRLRDETKKQSSLLKASTNRPQSFIPRRTSTPASKRSLSRNNEHRHSFHLSSLPEVSVTPARPNRWSIGDMTRSFMESNESLPNSPSASEGSDLQLCMDSEMESSPESEGWSAPSSPEVPKYAFGDEDDDDESFLQGIRIRDDVLITGRINICDLAGSERIKKSGVEGERLSELQHVNLSLLELGNTIHALSEGKRTHIPYRNSPLTRLLQDSLGGNCKTSFVMCISPLLRDVNETRCTLDFGLRALKITTTAYVNVEVDYIKLSEDLRKRIEIQELEIKAQKDNFEKQSYEIKSAADVKLAEVQALLEAERDLHKTEIQNLQQANETLEKTLFDERSQRHVLEGMHHASLEAAVLIERQRIVSSEECEKRKLQSALDEEKRRSWTIEQRTKEEYEKAIEEEKRRSNLLKQLERERLEKSLEEEKQRITELEKRLVKSPSHERYTQTIAMFDEQEFPRMPPGTNQTETLYNVLLAEIMSLQLLYQMQDLSQACSGADDLRSRDSGCAEYEDDVIHSVSSSVLEKGGLLLNNLRGRQRGDSRFSLMSTDSLRELYLLQFPPSPKLSRESRKPGSVPMIASKSSFLELHSDSKKSFSSTDSDGPRGHDGASSSSIESFLEDEPLSPRCRNRPSDSGCSSQHSDSEHSPGANTRSYPIEIVGRARAQSNPVKRSTMNACVPLAEEEDEDLDLVASNEILSVKRKVVHLANDLCRLKTELDSETINFFSEVFGVKVPFMREGESPRVMRRLFEGVKENLLSRICAGPGNNDEDEEDLTPPLLEEAVNLLLVNKTVMSCILVLQNRRDTEKNQESTTTELPTVIHVPLKVDRELQTDPEPIRSLRRRIKKDAGVVTDPLVKVQLSDKECQTSKEHITDRVQELKPAEQESFLESSPNVGPWHRRSDSNLDRASHDSITLESREPDGASSEEYPAVSEEDHDDEENKDGGVLSSSEDVYLKDAKGKKKKRQKSLFACLSPARLSFRKKPERANESKTDTTKLVKEI